MPPDAAPETAVAEQPSAADAAIEAAREAAKSELPPAPPDEKEKEPSPAKDAKSEPPPAPPKETDRWAALARQQAAIRRERDAFVAEKKRLSDERAAWETERTTSQKQKAEDSEGYERYRQARGTVKENPLAALSSLGIETPYQLREFSNLMARAVLSGGLPDPMAPVRLAEQRAEEKIAAFRKEQEAREAAAKEAAGKAAAEATEKEIARYEAEVLRHVEGAKTPEGTSLYRYTQHFERADMVPDLMRMHFEETGEVMPVAEAAQKVEAYWRAKYEALAPPPVAKPNGKPTAKAPAPGLAGMSPAASPGAGANRTDAEREAAADAALAALGLR